MKSSFFFVSFVALLLISSAFGQSFPEIVKQLKGVAEECGNSAAGNEAATCVANAVRTVTEAPTSVYIFIQATRLLSDCLQPFKGLVTNCGKDNYITILEGLRAIGQNDGQLVEKFQALGTNPNSLPCTRDEDEKISRLTASCMREKGIRDYEYEPDRFCWFVSGFRACIQLAHDNISPEDCPKSLAHASDLLSIFDSIENGAENSAAVNRCFNTAAE